MAYTPEIKILKVLYDLDDGEERQGDDARYNLRQGSGFVVGNPFLQVVYVSWALLHCSYACICPGIELPCFRELKNGL